jgi:hypothetical protein
MPEWVITLRLVLTVLAEKLSITRFVPDRVLDSNRAARYALAMTFTIGVLLVCYAVAALVV